MQIKDVGAAERRVVHEIISVLAKKSVAYAWRWSRLTGQFWFAVFLSPYFVHDTICCGVYSSSGSQTRRPESNQTAPGLFLPARSHFLSVFLPSSQTAHPGDGACRLLFVEGVTGQECFLSAPFPLVIHACMSVFVSGSGLLEGGIQKGVNRLMASICPGTVLQNKEVWSTSARLSWVYFTLRVGARPRS